ncbi:MAG TPA: hypothetical protein VIG66_08855 [Noviherbaspirillum sp.]
MHSPTLAPRQPAHTVRLLMLVACTSTALLAIVLLLQVWRDIPTEHLTRDPNAIFDVQMYIGFLSQAGIFVWAATAGICLFCARIASARAAIELARFALAAGLVTLLLGLDDAFMLHEQFFPFLGIPEKMVYVLYGVCVLAFLLRFRAQILQHDYLLLALALMLFALSVSLDWLQPEGIDIFLVEDGAKMTGILSWSAFFLSALLRRLVQPAG